MSRDAHLAMTVSTKFEVDTTIRCVVAESYCGTVGNMRNAESCPVGGRMRFHMGCRGGGGGRRVEQNISLATFVCNSDLSCKYQIEFHNFVKGS